MLRETLFGKLLRLPGWHQAGVVCFKGCSLQSCPSYHVSIVDISLEPWSAAALQVCFLLCVCVGRKTCEPFILCVRGFIGGFGVMFLPEVPVRALKMDVSVGRSQSLWSVQMACHQMPNLSIFTMPSQASCARSCQGYFQDSGTQGGHLENILGE